MKRIRKKPEHYVDNKLFLAKMIEYKKTCNKAEREKKEKPPVTNYIGSCFLKIANHLSFRPNFINYTFRDDMVSDGIENCLQYLSNFNPRKSKNPFAYFTQIIYYAFLRRIEKEKKQLYIKYKTMDEYNSIEDYVDMGEMKGTEASSISSGTSPMTADKRANIYDFISTFEEKKRKKKKAREVSKKDDDIAQLSPLVSYMEGGIYA